MVSEALLVALTGAIAGGTLIITAIFSTLNRPRRPRATAPTSDLGPESPAVVDLLTDDFEVTREAAPATLLDLAARGRLEIESVGGQTILRPRQRGREAFASYEEQVLEHVQGISEGGVVPAGALTTGPEGASTRWWRRFTKAVIEEARGAGLCRPRWGPVQRGVISLGAAASVILMGVAIEEPGDIVVPAQVSDLWFWTVVALALSALIVAVRVDASLRQRDTEAGLETAGRWLGVRRFLAQNAELPDRPAAAVAVYGRHLAYAAALGLASAAVRDMPLGAEDDHHAWSRASGTWRLVLVRYPGILRPGWGSSPLRAGALGLVVAAAGLLLAWVLSRISGGIFQPLTEPSQVVRWVEFGVSMTAIVSLGVAAMGAVLVVRALADLSPPREVEGVVLRRRVFSEGRWAHPIWRAFGFPADEVQHASSSDENPRYYLAVDTGSGQAIDAWRVGSGIYHRVRQGARVRILVTPHLRHVRRIEELASSPAGESGSNGIGVRDSEA